MKHNNSTFSYEFINDKNLSLKAKGLLWVILINPELISNISGLMRSSKDGRDSTRAAFNELRQMNYILGGQTRNESGTLGKCSYTLNVEMMGG